MFVFVVECEASVSFLEGRAALKIEINTLTYCPTVRLCTGGKYNVVFCFPQMLFWLDNKWMNVLLPIILRQTLYYAQSTLFTLDTLDLLDSAPEVCSNQWEVFLPVSSADSKKYQLTTCDALTGGTVGVFWEVSFLLKSKLSKQVQVPNSGTVPSKKLPIYLYLLSPSCGPPVIVVEADADLLSLDSELDCVLPLRDSNFPEKPEQPSGEPVCVWWRIQRFLLVETKLQAPVWETNKVLFTSIHVHIISTCPQFWVKWWAAVNGVVNLCRGGILSMVLRLFRVDTTLKLSLQSQETCRWCRGCLFSTMTMSPAQPCVR